MMRTVSYHHRSTTTSIAIILSILLVVSDAFQPLSISSISRRSQQQGLRGRGKGVLYAQQIDSNWNRVSILEVRPAAEGLMHIAVDGGDLLSTYTIPGQYVQLKPHAPGAKPGFFAIASPPSLKSGSTKAEFLIKRTEGTNWICDAKEGDMIDMTAAQGKGFSIDKFDEEGINFILMLAAGSGIAPIRAAIESEALGLEKMKRYGRLYYGVRTPAHMAYTELFDDWKERGVDIHPVYSRTPAPLGSNGYWGYIQQAVSGDEVPKPDKTAALLCGMKEMTARSTDIMVEKGVKPERILLNF